MTPDTLISELLDHKAEATHKKVIKKYDLNMVYIAGPSRSRRLSVAYGRTTDDSSPHK